MHERICRLLERATSQTDIYTYHYLRPSVEVRKKAPFYHEVAFRVLADDGNYDYPYYLQKGFNKDALVKAQVSKYLSIMPYKGRGGIFGYLDAATNMIISKTHEIEVYFDYSQPTPRLVPFRKDGLHDWAGINDPSKTNSDVTLENMAFAFMGSHMAPEEVIKHITEGKMVPKTIAYYGTDGRLFGGHVPSYRDILSAQVLESQGFPVHLSVPDVTSGILAMFTNLDAPFPISGSV